MIIKKKYKKGFVALSLVISIFGMIFAFMFIQSIEIGIFFDQTIKKEYRLINYYNAYSCIDLAILNISHDYFYEISTTTDFIDLQCSIDMVKRENNKILINTHGNYKNIKLKRSANIMLYDNRVEIVSID